MIGGVKSQLGQDPKEANFGSVDPGIEPTTKFIKMPANEQLKGQILERVYNPAVAGAYIRFMKSFARALLKTGDPETEAYKLAIGFMADDHGFEDLVKKVTHEDLGLVLS